MNLKKLIVGFAAAGALLAGSTAAMAVPVTVYSDDFSSNQGWTLGTNWQIGSTSVSPAAVGNGDPALDHTDTSDNGVLGALLGGNIGGPDGLHGYYYATSKVYNLSGVTNVNLSYYRWLNSDYDPFMTSQAEVFNGSAWQVIYTNCCIGGSGYVNDNNWNLQSFDASSYADNNANFQVRFSYDVTSGGVYTIGGWNVDDLAITGNVPEPGSLALLGLGLAGLAYSRKRKASPTSA